MWYILRSGIRFASGSLDSASRLRVVSSANVERVNEFTLLSSNVCSVRTEWVNKRGIGKLNNHLFMHLRKCCCLVRISIPTLRIIIIHRILLLIKIIAFATKNMWVHESNKRLYTWCHQFVSETNDTIKSLIICALLDLSFASLGRNNLTNTAQHPSDVVRQSQDKYFTNNGKRLREAQEAKNGDEGASKGVTRREWRRRRWMMVCAARKDAAKKVVDTQFITRNCVRMNAVGAMKTA